MWKVSQWPLARKLGAAFGLISMIVLAQAAFVWHSISGMDQQVIATSARLIPQEQRIADLEMNIIRASLETRHAMLMRTPEKREEAIAVVLKHKERADALGREIESHLSTDEGRRRFKALTSSKDAFWSAAGEIAGVIKSGDNDKALDLLTTTVIPARNAFLAQIQAQREWQQTYVQQASIDTLRRGNVTEAAVIAASLLVAVVGLALAFVMGRHVSRQLGGEPAQAVEAMRTISRGDLVTPVLVRDGDTDSVMAAVAEMRRSLTLLIHQVQQGVDSVNTAAGEIASGNTDLSQRTEQQASSLQETASAMTQMTASVKANADNARQANQMATSASEAAQNGGQVVGRVVETMGEIRASSQKIADIIGTIDGIAFQTNILALNAAVEAARAGEAGRGFAVVASEVRSLASRSAEAAREIKQLIGESVEKVGNGHALVTDAGRSMDEIVQQVRRVTDLIGEISSATEEQSRGIAEVGAAVAQIDQGTQQNAALVEESAAAAESLKQQAAHLAQAVGSFRTPGGAGSRTAAAPPARLPQATAKPLVAPARPAVRAPAAPALPPAAVKAPATTADDDWATF